MPIYNEKSTLEEIFQKIVAVPIEKEIIMVDDGSTDGTRDILKKYEKLNFVKVIYQKNNFGKGSAIRAGIPHVSGDITIIQDADLEYDPNDYLKLVRPIKDKKEKVIYGSRFKNKSNKHSYRSFYLGGLFVSFITNILYWQKLTDEPTCYKVFDTELLKSIKLNCTGFEFCPEVTAKVAKKGIKIKEIPINYYPRTLDEGKKITWKDGIQAIWVLLKYRFVN